MQDLRFALRTLWKQPVFAAVAILTLTIGIGANTAIFSLLYHLLLRPLPYPSAERLVFIWNTYPGADLPKASVSIPDYLDRKGQADAIEDAALYTGARVSLTSGEPEQLVGLMVTPSFFSTLGRQPALGRGFHDSEAVPPDAVRSVILTHAFWRSRGADASVLEKPIQLNGRDFQVVGVLGADFELPARDVSILLPFGFTPQQTGDTGRGNEFSTMIARLRPGATIEQLDAQMKAIVDRNLERLPQFVSFARTSGFGGYAVPFREEMLGADTRLRLLIIQGGVFLVLLIACANVANLLLMRATGRLRELAIRTTLGAGRWRLARQLLTEGLVLALAGGILGAALGYVGLQALVGLSEQQLPALGEPSVHPPVLLFTLLLSAVTGLVFGLVPAVTVLRGNASALLKDDATRGTASRRTGATRAALVVVETALALVLLAGAGLLLKSFAQVQDVDPGFSTDNVLTARIALPSTRYADAAARRAFWQRLTDEARAIPGAAHLGLSSIAPFSGTGASGTYRIVGYTPPDGQPPPHGRQTIVGADFFTALRIPLLEGRLFTDSDTADSPPVVIIDEYLARRYFPNESPIGREILRGGPDSPPIRIVGVVGTVNAIDLAEPVEKERLYYPVSQQPAPSMVVLLKTGTDPAALVPALRSAVRALDPQLPLADVRTIDQWLSRSLQTRRAPMVLLVVFGLVALLLSAIGIYGVLAFGVAQRAREIGIRQALGADRGSILALVLRQGLRSAAIGVAIGLAASLALARYIESQLFGVRAHDIQVLAAVTAMLLLVAVAACYIPARRATRVDPMVALRES